MVGRHEFLRGVHEAYRPRSYLEIGVHKGHSLALSRVSSIGVDPEFTLTQEIACDLRLFRETSDEFFARPDAVAHLPGGRIDLAFIDGLHLFEYALRDFINVERHARWTSVVIFDDVLPRSVREAARNRQSAAWTGDVYKLVPVLARYRPDLTLLTLDTQPTGLLVVLGLNPDDTTLTERYDEIVEKWVTDDPQAVPADVLQRSATVRGKRVLAAGYWATLAGARDQGISRRRGQRRLRKSVQRSLAGSRRARTRRTVGRLRRGVSRRLPLRK